MLTGASCRKLCLLSGSYQAKGDSFGPHKLWSFCFRAASTEHALKRKLPDGLDGPDCIPILQSHPDIGELPTVSHPSIGTSPPSGLCMALYFRIATGMCQMPENPRGRTKPSPA